MPDDVRELVDHSLAGDEQAMAALVGRFQGTVLGTCWRMLGCREDAEDAAQETFIRALRHLRRWDATREFAPWLYKIAGNCCRSALARRAQRPAMQPLDSSVSDGVAGPSGEAALREELRRAVSLLRPEYQQAFWLFHEQQLTCEEIAAAMSRPTGTIKSWIHRARHEIAMELSRRGALDEAQHAV